MKIPPNAQATVFDRLSRLTRPIGPENDASDLVSALNLRKTQVRAFSFEERGVLALADAGASAATAVTSPSASPRPPAPVALGEAAGPTIEVPRTPPGGLAIEPGERASLVAPASSPNLPTTPPTFSALGQTWWAAARAAAPTTAQVGRDEVIGDLAGGLGGPQAPTQDPPTAGDTSLTIHWTSDGLVVFAAAPITSPEEIDRLRARAESIARDFGGKLAQFHLNGAPVAPQYMLRRV